MNIKTSLAVEKKESGKINLILSGSFVKVYNQSYYLLTEIVGRKLKPQAGFVKSADNQFVISGGFPVARVLECYPNAIKTSWGYQLIGEFDTTGYGSWLLRQKSAAQAVGDAVVAVLKPCPEEFGQGLSSQDITQIVNNSKPVISLTEQQYYYLVNWQRGRYPMETDLGFIESLQRLLIQKNKNVV